MWPLRGTIDDHLYAFRRHSGRRCFFLNAQMREVPEWFSEVEFDAIVFHTTFLSTRWAPELFEQMRTRAAPLATIGTERIALPQDEFLHADLLSDFINDSDVGVVLSVAPETEWESIYSRVTRPATVFDRILTGYLDDATVARIDGICRDTPRRQIDIGYRAWAGAPWLGRHGTMKGHLAQRVQARAGVHALRIDLSTRDEDTLLGDEWYRFLARCRYTIGIEGGASILDRDGRVKAATEAFLAQHPGATFEQIEEACFAGRDGETQLFALSPRHLEACATRTGQLLVEGDYNGLLTAQRHYIPISKDLSNLDAVLAELDDEQRRQELTDAAYDEVVSSGVARYSAFVRHVESHAIGGPAVAAEPDAQLDRLQRLNDEAETDAWSRVRTELGAQPHGDRPSDRLRRVLKAMHRSV